MDTVEQEIIEKFNQLQPDAKERVLARIGHGADAKTHSALKFDFAAWSHEIDNIRQQIQASHEGVFPRVDVVEMLRELRDGEDEDE